MEQRRCIAVMVHPYREEARPTAADFIRQLCDEGLDCLIAPEQWQMVSALVPDLVEQGRLREVEELDGAAELVVVFGGDGTILRAAEWAYHAGVPLLGVNLGHVGFLAELESSEIENLVAHVVNRSYQVEERLTLQVRVLDPDGVVVWESFAINEVSLEKAARERMLEVLVSIDDRPISRWGCDGVLVSTPTGSTAYAFSAGGPVMWPDVEAIELVPLSAHALFARAMVLSPSSHVDMVVLPENFLSGVVWCDGRRTVDVEKGSCLSVDRGPQPLRLARLEEQPFTTRLVKKFDLQVDGWRGSRRSQPSGLDPDEQTPVEG